MDHATCESHQHPHGYIPGGRAPVIARSLVTFRQALIEMNFAYMSNFVAV